MKELFITNNKDNPVVSIGIPVYNGAKFIIDTLNSIRTQSYSNIELSIVDDGSTDDSLLLCKQWANEMEYSVNLSRNEQNLGLTTTCNILLKKAKGKYFQLLGHDDILLPEKIEADVRLLEQAPADTAFVFSRVKLIDSAGKNLDEDYFERIGYDGKLKEPLFELLVQKNFIPAPTALVRTEMLRTTGGYDESLMFEDWDIWLRLSKEYKVLFNDVCNVQYRIHPDSMMANRDEQQTIKRNDGNIKMFKKYIGFCSNYDEVLYRKLKELTIYSFFIGDKNAKTKMLTYLGQKFDAKIGFYLLMALVGLKHPSRLFKVA
jgi:glycosyltransferase involved in cell wall biosynthesis